MYSMFWNSTTSQITILLDSVTEIHDLVPNASGSRPKMMTMASSMGSSASIDFCPPPEGVGNNPGGVGIMQGPLNLTITMKIDLQGQCNIGQRVWTSFPMPTVSSSSPGSYNIIFSSGGDTVSIVIVMQDVSGGGGGATAGIDWSQIVKPGWLQSSGPGSKLPRIGEPKKVKNKVPKGPGPVKAQR